MIEGDEAAAQSGGGADGIGLPELSGEHVDGLWRLDGVVHGSQLVMQPQLYGVSGDLEKAQKRDQRLQLTFSQFFVNVRKY